MNRCRQKKELQQNNTIDHMNMDKITEKEAELSCTNDYADSVVDRGKIASKGSKGRMNKGRYEAGIHCQILTKPRPGPRGVAT